MTDHLVEVRCEQSPNSVDLTFGVLHDEEPAWPQRVNCRGHESSRNVKSVSPPPPQRRRWVVDNFWFGRSVRRNIWRIRNYNVDSAAQ